MTTLSVAIITLNEEANIKACINSVISIADEIVVVDSGSTDATVEIARSMGATVMTHSFEGYAEQKNVAMSKCTSPYVLCLDADEVVHQNLAINILEQKKKKFPYDAYRFQRITFIGERAIGSGAWSADSKIRLVKKELASWSGKGVHERLNVNSTNIYALSGYLLHYSYKDVSDILEKTRKYAELGAVYLHQEGRTISLIGVQLKAISRFLRHYVLKLGFLDGYYGWIIGKQQYCEAFWKYKRLYQINKK